MIDVKETEAMDSVEQYPYWMQEMKKHEGRLTANEKDVEKLKDDLKDIKEDNREFKADIRELKTFISDGNQEQLKALHEMNAKMRDEFFGKKRTTQAEKWKLFGIIATSLLGGSGFLIGGIGLLLKYL